MATHNTNGAEMGAWSYGWVAFAGWMMIIVGFFEAFEGLAAVFNGDLFSVAPNYIYALDATTWGWIHLGFSVIVVCAGFALFAGKGWARVVGIILAMLSALANFAFIPYYPFWSILVIAIDIAIIGALASFNPTKMDPTADKAKAY